MIDNGAPNFEPGADGQWSYSNTGYILIGMILEKIHRQAAGRSVPRPDLRAAGDAGQFPVE